MDEDISWLAKAAGFDPASQEAHFLRRQYENPQDALAFAALEDHRKEGA